MEFPLRNKSLISDPVLSPETMNYFFNIKTQVFKELSDMEKFILREMYNTSDYHKLIPEPSVVQMRSRKRKRLETKLEGRMYSKSSTLPVSIQVQSISEKGLGGYMTEKVEGQKCILHINIEGEQPCIVSGHIARVTEDGVFGFVIDNANEKWIEFFKSVDSRLIASKAQYKKTGS